MKKIYLALVSASAVTIATLPALSADYNWKRDAGQTINVLVNNNSLGNALVSEIDNFEKLTGISVKPDTYNEQQMRQRLLTVMNAHSDEFDVFMTLPSREGEQFDVAGWVTDLSGRLKDDVAPDYDPAGLSKALLKAGTFSGKVTSVPMNIEGPILYVRADIFQKCNVEIPKRISDIAAAAKKIKACDADVTPFVSRGLRSAVAYTFSNFLHNYGGSYMKDGKSNLCSREGQEALQSYSNLLRDYGPPGVVNYSFLQIGSLYGAGRAAMSFATSNQLSKLLENPARRKDTLVMPLPTGPGGSVPTTIGWGLAMSPFSKKQDAAWLFIQWATSPGTQKALALKGIAPPRAAVADDPVYKAWLDKLPVRKQWEETLTVLGDKGTSEVGYPIIENPRSRDFIGEAVVDIMLGKSDVKTSCAAADKSLNKLIAEQHN